MTFPQMMMPGALAGSGTLSLFGSSTATSGATIALPADIAAGDLIVLVDAAYDTFGATTVVPAGFTSRHNAADPNFRRFIVSTKEAVGTEGGTSLTGMDGNASEAKVALVFRNNVVGQTPSGLTVGGTVTSAMNLSNPSSITTSATGSAPLVVLGFWFGSDAVSTQTTDLTMDGSLAATMGGRTDTIRAEWKIYNAGVSPATLTIDMDDEGTNSMCAFYVEIPTA